MIDEYAGDERPDALRDVELIAGLLVAAARDGRSVSYSELLNDLGLRFSRPKMRALCKTLAEVDRRSLAEGGPELAVLVVRESDRLPGQGWWVGRRDYAGKWEGAEARAFIAAIRDKAFEHWSR